MTVYIGRTLDGGLLIDTNIQVFRNIDAQILKAMPLEEYQAIGHHAVIVSIENDEVSFNLSDKIALQKRIAGFKARLEQIDHAAGAGRAFRAVAMDFGNLVRRLHDTNPDLAEFDPDGNEDLTRIINLETEAIAIRAQLSPLLTS